jgi:hypothetical protein
LKGALDLDLVSLHFILEGYLPGCQAMGIMVEDKAITLLPNDTSPNHEDLHEQRLGKSQFCKVELLMNVGIVIPGDTNNKPATRNRVAIKEKVFNSFFNILMIEKQPSKEFNSGDTFGFSKSK